MPICDIPKNVSKFSDEVVSIHLMALKADFLDNVTALSALTRQA